MYEGGIRVLRRCRESSWRRRTTIGAAGLAVAALLAVSGSAGAGPVPTSAAAKSPASNTTPAASVNTNWTTYDHSDSRAGLSSSTPTVTSAGNVKRGWASTVDGKVYAQPLVVGTRVIVATENDSIYAFGKYSGTQAWHRHLATPVPGSDLPCGDINPSGITGTPVADVSLNVLYVVTFSLPAHHTLWTINLTTGGVIRSRTIDGPGSDPKAEQQRGALVIDGDRVFVPYGGLDGDCSDYHGWVVGDGLRGRGGIVHFVTPTQREAGIWTPPGPAVGSGGLYVATGNGTPVTAVDDSDSVLRISPTTMKVLSRFTPSDYVHLSSSDLDLGTTSPVLLPRNNLFMIGKEGIGYVIGADNLGGTGHPLASEQICSGGFGGDAVSGDTVVMSCFDGLYAVRVTPTSSPAHPKMTIAWKATGIAPGPPIIAGGIVWDATRGNQLVGYDLSNGHSFFTAGLASVGTSFPTLSASVGRLFVPEGSEVVCYKGL